jgi:hypothetical protein
MSSPAFLTVLTICVVSGLLFAAGAFLTAFKAGGVLAPGAPGDAFRIGYKNYSLSTGNALVGLLTISLACMIVVPLFIVYLDSKIDDSPVFLGVDIAPEAQSVAITHSDDGTMNEVELTLYKTSKDQVFTVTNANTKYSPIHITAHYDRLTRSLIGVAQGRAFSVPVAGVQARVANIQWQPSKGQAVEMMFALPSKTAPVASYLDAIADPTRRL